jgi:hypothetical protein
MIGGFHGGEGKKVGLKRNHVVKRGSEMGRIEHQSFKAKYFAETRAFSVTAAIHFRNESSNRFVLLGRKMARSVPRVFQMFSVSTSFGLVAS